MAATVTIIRGLPGSGKSTLAKEIGADVICSADDFFVGDDGVYRFDASKLKEAHGWCYRKFEDAVKNGQTVVVDNTNTRRWEFEKYIDYAEFAGAKFEVIRIKHPPLEVCFKRNTHGVPLETIKKMAERFEGFAGEKIVDWKGE